VAEILKTFDLDLLDGYMILVCAALFVVLWLVLEKILFIPFLNLIAAREKATVGVEADAQDAYQKAQVGERDYQSKITEARQIAMEKKLKELDLAKKESDAIILKAESEAEQLVSAAKAETKINAEKARKDTMAQAESLASELTSKLKEPPSIVGISLN